MKKTLALLVSLFCASTLSLVEASAQQVGDSKKSAATSKSTSSSKTRGRRVAEGPTQTETATTVTTVTGPTTTEQPAEAKLEATAASPTVAEPPAENKTKQQPVDATTKSEVATKNAPAEAPDNKSSAPTLPLREQIDATPLGPERIKLQLQLAEELVTTGHRTTALAELNSIASVDVFDPAGFYNLGNAFARLGETDAAISAYQKAIDQRKGNYSRAYNNLGVVLLRVGRWDEAYDALLRALRLESFRYAEASYNLGRVYAANRQSDLAVREWRRALAVDPKHAAAAQSLANAGNEGRIVVESQPRTPEVKTVSTAAVSPRSVNVKSSTSARPAKPLSLDPVSFDLLQRARSDSERGNLLSAVDNFRRVLSRQGGYFAPANLEISYALLSLKRYDEAIENLQTVSNRDGARYPVSYFHLARVYEIKGELKLAEASFLKAAEAYGAANSQFLLDISRVREKQGDFKGALEVLERYVTSLDQQGLKPTWADERLTALRQKVSDLPK